jgi:hypothetical protein
MRNQRRAMCALAAAVLISAGLPGTALAVDGQIAITQAKAMAGNVTPGDAPGFPVTISQPGSYVLSGNLTVPDANTDVIQIDASHVTLDLNGFAILGPTDCPANVDTSHPCTGTGSGVGISSSRQFNITIRNGTVQGMGRYGIGLFGDSHVVEYIHAKSNGASGIVIFATVLNGDGPSIAQHNTAQRNGQGGIAVDSGLVSHNVVSGNLTGILVQLGVVSSNVVTFNGQGLLLGGNLSQASYIGNTMSFNQFGNVLGGRNLGQNLCGFVVCPGAQF